MQNSEIEELLTMKEACNILKVHPNTLRNWDTQGILKAKKIGSKGIRRYTKRDLADFMNKPGKTTELPSKKRILDLFSGCGGLSYGLSKAGFDIVMGIDCWSDALNTFERNHPGAKTLKLDLERFNPESIEKAAGADIQIIVGGPPCQGFSISGKRDPNDNRNKLYRAFVSVVAHYMPEAFILENVPNLVSMAKGAIKDEIISDFSRLGYDVSYKILLASDYGVPQNRKRVIFIGMKGKNVFQYPQPLFSGNYRTCSDAISDLPENTVEEGAANKSPPLSEYQKCMRANTNRIFNHETSEHSQQTISTIALVPDGGNSKHLPAHLKDIRKVNIAWTRYCSTKPSLTIDTGHRHHFHYKYNRIPTVRESARLQSFPDDFIFFGSKTSQYKQVGNAVPPLLAEAIGLELKKALNLALTLQKVN